MTEAIPFLIRHGYALLFSWVLVEQMGLPIPAIPLLLAAGALTGSGRMDLALAMGTAVSAVLVADMFWYYLGRYRGSRVLKLLCRISLDLTRVFAKLKMCSFVMALNPCSLRNLFQD